MFYLSGIIITFFLTIILLTKKGKTIADNVLAAWLFVIGMHLFLFYWNITGELYKHAYLLGIQIPMPLLQGPLLYIYTVTATRDQGFVKTNWLHFIPAAIAYVALSKFFLLSPEEKINVYKHEGAGFETYTTINLIALIVSGFTYVLLSFYELRKYKKKINDEFSDTEKINLNWLRYLIYGILIIWVIILLNGHDPLIFGAVVVFVMLIGYFGIKHIGIFTYRKVILKQAVKPKEDGISGIAISEDSNVKEETELLPAVEKKEIYSKSEEEADSQTVARVKYERSGLQKEEADKIYLRLNQLMQKEKTYKKEELSLAYLAQLLGIHSNNLSQVINTYEKKSFYDYINSLRIEEFKKLALLPENSRYTLLSLAFECGFNSKTSFNRNFKKITGESPSAYLKKLNVELVSE